MASVSPARAVRLTSLIWICQCGARRAVARRVSQENLHIGGVVKSESHIDMCLGQDMGANKCARHFIRSKLYDVSGCPK